MVTSSAGVTKRVGIHRDPGSKKIVLWGSLPLGDAGMKEPMSIEDPAEFVAQLFRTMLERRGITIRGKTRARHGEGAEFFDQQIAHPSLPTAEVAAFVRQFSDVFSHEAAGASDSIKDLPIKFWPSIFPRRCWTTSA